MSIRCGAGVAATLLLGVLSTAFAQPVTLRDDRGTTITLASEARRIVTLSPHLAELVYAAGAGDRLIAVAHFSDFPDAVRTLPRIGDAARIDVERIRALDPDLVLAWKSGNPPSDIAALERLGYQVYVSEVWRLPDVPRVLRAIGLLAGTQPHAESEARVFEEGVRALREQYMHRRVLRVFYEIWHRPLFTVNGEQLISDVLSVCGGRNVFANAPALVPAVSLEAVIAARPEAILGGSEMESSTGFVDSWRRTGLASMRGIPVYYVPPNLVHRQTPRVLEGARLICRELEEARRTQGRR